ncbi:MAG: glycosyltransferase family 2 protein, partial [Acidobacteriota bacterium]|nr:glycosyltransferase family 2 protein [Acidobacteriota bacterium]
MKAPVVEPLVTVCMPSYNYGRFLSHAVESVLAQTYSNFELLVVDNGSSDDSHQMARSFAARDPRVQVLTHPGHANRGVNASLNLGLANASGAYFGLLPADDMYMPDGLERRVALLESAPDSGLVYGLSQTLVEDGRPSGHIGGRGPEEMLLHDDTSDLLEAILFHDFVPGAAMLAR